MANIEWDIQQVQGQVKTLQQTVYGNGQEGLTSRVRGTEDEISNVRKIIEKHETRIEEIRKWQWLAVGGIWVITVVLQVFGPAVVTRAEAFFR